MRGLPDWTHGEDRAMAEYRGEGKYDPRPLEEDEMPHFCECGSDTYICQRCGTVACDTVECPHYRHSEWIKGIGNVCSRCLALLESAAASKALGG